MAEDFKRPGWYPAPDGEPGERWWNGSGWSESRRGAPGAPVPLPPVPSVVYGADNPAPQRPDPYAAAGAPVASGSRFTIDARQNRLATAALITGVVGLAGISVLGPVAIVLSIIGISRARTLKAQGGPASSIVLAAIGLVAGIIATFALVVAIVAFFAAITFDVSS
jgi:hypothetical protein